MMLRAHASSDAETIALQALGWMAGPGDVLGVFLGSTGLDAEELKSRLDDPDLLASVLDFVLMDDAWVQGAAQAAGVPPEALRRARLSLAGGPVPDWS
jgi:hypothetical protein